MAFKAKFVTKMPSIVLAVFNVLMNELTKEYTKQM